MEYRCEDLPQYGVVLLPPSLPDYAGLLADIQKRLANPIPGSAPNMLDLEDPGASHRHLMQSFANRHSSAVLDLEI